MVSEKRTVPSKIIFAITVLIVLAVVADFYALFGVREARVGDYLHLTFQFSDSESGAVVPDVHVVCTRPRVRSACTEKRGPGAGQTTITLNVLRQIRQSILFSKVVGYTLGDSATMTLTFIPENHARRTLEVAHDDPLLSESRPHRIELVRRRE